MFGAVNHHIYKLVKHPGTARMKIYAAIILILSLAACTANAAKNDCSDIAPAFNGEMLQVSNNYQEKRLYGGWELYTYNQQDRTTLPALVWRCRRGTNNGERPDHYYCGDQNTGSWMIYAKKTTVNDGVITGVERRSFLAEYDSTGQHIITTCGGIVRGPDESQWT